MLFVYQWMTVLYKFCSEKREKGLDHFWQKRKSKQISFKINKCWLQSVKRVIKCAHYVCVNERLHLSWPEIFTHTGLQGDLWIKNLSQIDLFSAILYSYFNFCYQKSISAEYLHINCTTNSYFSHTLSLFHMSTHRGNQAYVFRHI